MQGDIDTSFATGPTALSLADSLMTDFCRHRKKREVQMNNDRLRSSPFTNQNADLKIGPARPTEDL